MSINNSKIISNNQISTQGSTSSINNINKPEPSIFGVKKSNTTNNTEFNSEAFQKYWDAVMQTSQQRDFIYNKISQYTGVSEYKDFPIEAKAIANKINDFCNNMNAGALMQAKDSSDIDNEIKKCLKEVEAMKNECLTELKELYEPDKNKETKNSFNLTESTQTKNPFSSDV